MSTHESTSYMSKFFLSASGRYVWSAFCRAGERHKPIECRRQACSGRAFGYNLGFILNPPAIRPSPPR
jgi:hypothetical protein